MERTEPLVNADLVAEPAAPAPARRPRVEDFTLADLAAVRNLLRGGSVIDWHRLYFNDRDEVDRFLRVNELDPRSEEDMARLEDLHVSDPEHSRLSESVSRAVTAWAEAVQDLGAEAKGLWLVDFDAGSGYYCWKYPETTVSHYHGYDEGFAGRMKIV